MKHFRHILVGWLIDGSGGPVRRQVLMTWKESALVSLKEAQHEDLEGSPVEDFGAFTVLPGLVDAHVHLSMSGTDDPETRKGQINVSFDQARTKIEHHITQNIMRGVVALRDGGDREAHVFLYKKRVLREASLPVVLKAPRQAWHAPGRYGKLIGRTPRPGETLAEAVTRTWTGSDHTKIVNSGLNSLTRFGQETAPQFGVEELEEAVKRAHALGLKVMVHANGRVPVGWAVEAACDSIEHGFFMGRENLEKMAERGTMWVPTAITMAAYAKKMGEDRAESDVAKRTLDHQLNQIRLANGLGVSIAAGTDSGSLGVNHGEALSEELRLLMTAGFTLEEAVRCASCRGAALLNVEDHTGVLAPGRPATFVAVKAAPEGVLDALKAPYLVVVKGKVVHHAAVAPDPTFG
jgi:imidazolonepropionase-like amidohydrolase